MEILDNYEFSRGSSSDSFDFDLLFDGQTRRLHRGEDFSSKPKSVRQRLSLMARRRGKKLQTKIEGDDAIVIRAFDHVLQANAATGGGTTRPRRRSSEKRSAAA